MTEWTLEPPPSQGEWTLDQPSTPAPAPAAPAAAAPGGWTLSEPAPGVLDYITETLKAPIRGGMGNLASELRGAGAQQARTAPIAGQRLSESLFSAALRGTVPEVIQEPGTGAIPPTSEQSMYKAGEAVEGAAPKSRQILNPFFEKLAEGSGSLLYNIGRAFVPVVGPPTTVLGTLLQGQGEAAERAVKAKATPEQQIRAAEWGTAASVTEFVDNALPLLGSPGRVLGLIGKIGLAAAMEGIQEGGQQFIQNLIAKGIYKPDQDIWEEVPENALVGAILGGAAGGIAHKVGEKMAPVAPATSADVEAAGSALRGGSDIEVGSAARIGAPQGAPGGPQLPQGALEPQTGVPQPVPPAPIGGQLAAPAPVEGAVVQPLEQPSSPTGTISDILRSPDLDDATKIRLTNTMLEQTAGMRGLRIPEVPTPENSWIEPISGPVSAISREEPEQVMRRLEADLGVREPVGTAPMTSEDMDRAFFDHETTRVARNLNLTGPSAARATEIAENAFEATYGQVPAGWRTTEPGSTAPPVRGNFLESQRANPGLAQARYDMARQVAASRTGAARPTIGQEREDQRLRNWEIVEPGPEQTRAPLQTGLSRVPLAPGVKVGHEVRIGDMTSRLRETYGNHLIFDITLGDQRGWADVEIKPEVMPGPGPQQGRPVPGGDPHGFAWVGWLGHGGYGGAGMPWSIGAEGLNKLRLALKDIVPSLKVIGGYRVSGARGRAGAPKVAIRSTENGLIEVLEGPEGWAKAVEDDVNQDVISFRNIRYFQTAPDGTTRTSAPVRVEPTSEWLHTGWMVVNQQTMDLNNPIHHDNTLVRISDLQQLSMSELGRDRFGARYDQFVGSIGRMMGEVRNALIATGLPQHRGLENIAFGVSTDPEYSGAYIRAPFLGAFINPMNFRYSFPDLIARRYYQTMVHEWTHREHPDHGETTFVPALALNMRALEQHPGFNAEGFRQRLIDLVRANSDIVALWGAVRDGTYGPVQSRSRGFRGVGADTRDHDGVSGYGAGPREGGAGIASLEDPAEQGPLTPRTQPRPGDFHASSPTGGGPSADNGRGANDRIAAAAAQDPGIRSAPVQPETRGIRAAVDRLYSGNTPPPIREAAASGDRMNWAYKWIAGILELRDVNPNFTPLVRYVETIQRMDGDEARIHDQAQHISKEWRRLGEEGDRLSAAIHELTYMSYLSQAEKDAGTVRLPTDQELGRIFAKYKISQKGSNLFQKMTVQGREFLRSVAEARIANDPRSAQSTIAHLRALYQRPYFPFMHFGHHYVMLRDPSGRTIHVEMMERRGFKSAKVRQAIVAKNLSKKFQQDYGRAPTAQELVVAELPRTSQQLVGMPKLLLDMMVDAEFLTPQQINDAKKLSAIQDANGLPILHPRYQQRYALPGYSVPNQGTGMDAKRSYAKYYFFGAKHYARAKYNKSLRDIIAQAKTVPLGTKERGIVEYMDDHFTNTVSNPDTGLEWLKAMTFHWALGFSVAGATQNLSQTPLVTYPWLAWKFGGLGLGDLRATRAMVNAMRKASTYYKKETLAEGGDKSHTEFELRALDYGVQSGVIRETQASELAAIKQSDGLLSGAGANKAQRFKIKFFEMSGMMFELAEQFNRRIAYRAALELATKYPNSNGVKEAVRFYPQEVADLMAGTLERAPFTEAQARAIVAAKHATLSTQFDYSVNSRPRLFRGKKGAVFIFQRYTQSILALLGQSKTSGFTWRYLTLMLLLGGLSGLPGAEDLKDLVKGVGRRLGFNTDPERDLRRALIDMFGDKGPLGVDWDMVLHGLARRGIGIPMILDAMGSLFTGRPGRGFAAPRHTMRPDGKPVPQGFATNVPYPVLDRSRALGLGKVLPFSPGKLIEPNANVDKLIATQAQQAVGAGFSVAFNMYKAMQDANLPVNDPKRYEKMMPRVMGNVSAAFRAYNEGRERSRGGPGGGTTVVNYDPYDTEQMMEIIARGLGYNTLRSQAHWDVVIAKAETMGHFDEQKKGLLAQFYEAKQNGRPEQVRDVLDEIKKFNSGLPAWAKAGAAIGDETLQRSYEGRVRGRIQRESGIPGQEGKVPMAREIERLYPEATIDVRRVR